MSRLWFYVPNYLESDFDDSLSVNGKQCIINYNAATPTTEIMNLSTLNFKSNARGLNDNTLNIQCSKSSIVKKGDYITDPNSNIYIVNWAMLEEINCKSGQVQLCNLEITFQRFQNKVIDNQGIQSTPCMYIDIAPLTRCYYTRTGVGWYDANSGNVGIIPSQRIELGMQYNDYTRNLRISDEFLLYGKPQIVSDIDYSQVNTGGNDGILIVYAQLLEGGRFDST